MISTVALDSISDRSGESGALPPLDQPSPPLRIASRVSCHVAGAIAFLVALIFDLAHGWRPTGDDAIIAQRAWSVFSVHPPLVGQFSTGSGGLGHTFYDPGPLLFWLLAIPVRVDPIHGVLWGSVLLCLAAVALAIEAAWAFRGAAGAAIVVLFVTVVATTQSFVAVNPAWNPSVGVVWFITAIALAVTVASGKLRWWPALVGAASIAAQAHLEFSPTAVGLVLLGLGLGLARRAKPQKRGWLAIGIGVGAVCWTAPLVQQLNGQPGNLTTAWGWLGHRPTYGVKFGLQCLASVTGPHPLWLSRQNRGSNFDPFLGLMSHITGRSELFGVAVLALLALIATGSWILRRRDIATLACVALLVGTLAVWTFSSLPQASILSIVYSDVVLWPVGMLVWLVCLWTAAAIVSAAVRALHRWSGQPAVRTAWRRRARTASDGPGALPAVTPAPSGRRFGTASGWLGAIGILLVGVAGATVAAGTVSDPHLGVPGGWSAVDLVPSAAADVNQIHPRGPIALWVQGPNSDVEYSVAYGVIWQLRQEGRDVTAAYPHWQPLGPAAAPGPGETELTVHVGAGPRVVVTRGQ